MPQRQSVRTVRDGCEADEYGLLEAEVGDARGDAILLFLREEGDWEWGVGERDKPLRWRMLLLCFMIGFSSNRNYEQ